MQQTEKRTKGTVIVNQLSAIHRLEQKAERKRKIYRIISG